MADNNNGSNTILVTVVIVLIIGLAFYFGFMRGGVPGTDNAGGDANIEVNVPDLNNGGGGEAPTE